MVSAVRSVSARLPFCGVVPRNPVAARTTFAGRGSTDASACSRSSSSNPAGEEDNSRAVVLLHRFSPPSCEHAQAEKGNFPSAKNSSMALKDAPAPGGCRDVDAAARSPSASVVAKCWDPRGFRGVCCTYCAG
jgi:hypothetical protein